MSGQPEQSIISLLAWFADIGVDGFDLAVQRRRVDGRPGPFLAPGHTGAAALGSDLLALRLPWLRAQNAAGHDIYFRPCRDEAWPVIFLDDLPPGKANRIADKYGAAVIETSRGRCHLWLATAQPLCERERTGLQRDLVARLDGAADPGSVSGDHWGRLPGFRNYKPGRNCWVNLRRCSSAPPYCPTAPKTPNHRVSRRLHRRDAAAPDMSRMEWGWVRGCLEHGAPPERVLRQLIEHAQGRRGKTDAVRYARYTVAKACRLLGLVPPTGGHS